MRKKNYGPIYTMPLTIWITLFFVIPTTVVFLYSFMKKGLYGGVRLWEWTFDAYILLGNETFLKVVKDTLFISVFATLGTIFLAIPTSYFIARSKHKDLLLFLVIIPFWTNFLIRIYAWIALLGNNGLINNFLMDIGLIQNGIQMLYSQQAVILVTIYTYLPYAILPLYSTIEKFDFSLLEAARDLGASKRQAIFKVMIPNIKAGIVTATLFVFIPALGSYAIPLLVGSENSYMIGNLIANELTKTRNWPLASAMSMILTIITTIGVLLFVNANQSKTEEARQSKMNMTKAE